jgi:hypothetical protein
MAILFESVSDVPTEYEFNGETIINFGIVVIADTIQETFNYAIYLQGMECLKRTVRIPFYYLECRGHKP